MFVNLNGGYQFFVKCKLCSCMFIKQISTKFDKKVTIVKQYIGGRNITNTKKTPNIFWIYYLCIKTFCPILPHGRSVERMYYFFLRLTVLNSWRFMIFLKFSFIKQITCMYIVCVDFVNEKENPMVNTFCLIVITFFTHNVTLTNEYINCYTKL